MQSYNNYKDKNKYIKNYYREKIRNQIHKDIIFENFYISKLRF